MPLIQPVKNGVMEEKKAIENTSKDTTGTSELGKDAFLQLLVAQMKYQDPFNPTSDTEYIAQLAQFSQLEQLQNMAATNENTQMLSMVGSEVEVSFEKDDGTILYKEGVVSGVTVSGGKAYLNVDGGLYDSEHLVQVYEKGYLLEKKMPKVSSQNYAYDGENPKGCEFTVDFGSEEGRATDIALIVDGDLVVNPEYITKLDNSFSINQDVFHQLTPGQHTFSVVFNNSPYYTTRENFLTVDVINSEPKEDSDVFMKNTDKENEEKTETV